MADWRSRGKGGDPDMQDDEPDRRHQKRRGHGRGSRGFGSSQEFGASEEFPFPADFGAPPFGGEPQREPARRYSEPARDGDRGGYGSERGGYGGDGHNGDQPSGYRPRSAAPRAEEPSAELGPRQNGTVKFFKADKGFGFITPDSGTIDVFVHISAVERSGLTSLESGQRLSFATEPDRRGKGPKAVELQLEDGQG